MSMYEVNVAYMKQRACMGGQHHCVQFVVIKESHAINLYLKEKHVTNLNLLKGKTFCEWKFLLIEYH